MSVDQLNNCDLEERPRVVVVGTGCNIASIVELLTRASVEVTVATIEPTHVIKKRVYEPLDDGFAASYLTVEKKKFRNDKPYLKKRKGRS